MVAVLVSKLIEMKVLKTVSDTFVLYVGDDENANEKVKKLMKKLNTLEGWAVAQVHSLDPKESELKLVSSKEITKKEYLQLFDNTHPDLQEVSDDVKLEYRILFAD